MYRFKKIYKFVITLGIVSLLLIVLRPIIRSGVNAYFEEDLKRDIVSSVDTVDNIITDEKELDPIVDYIKSLSNFNYIGSAKILTCKYEKCDEETYKIKYSIIIKNNSNLSIDKIVDKEKKITLKE